MGNGPQPAKLPDDAPQALKDFVACRTDTVELDTAAMGWVPSGGMGETPSITVEPGASDTEATVRVRSGSTRFDLPTYSDEDGSLWVDTTGIPEQAAGVKAKIDAWVASFNATMTENGAILGTFAIDGSTVSLTKHRDEHEPPGAQPAREPEPEAEPHRDPDDGAPETAAGGRRPLGCLTLVLVFLALVLVGAGAVWVLNDDDDDDAIATVTSDPSAATDAPAATDAATVTDAPDVTDAPAATDAVVTTDPPVATDPPATDPPITDPPSTGLGAEPFVGIFDELDLFLLEGDTDDDVLSVTPDEIGDVVDCEAGTMVDYPAPDITGVAGTVNGVADVAVMLDQSPTSTVEEEFSFAVLLQALTQSNQVHTFQFEMHDGVETAGQVGDDGATDPAGADITLDDNAVRFTFPVDPDDPIAAIFVRGFNTPAEGDVKGCDTANAAAIDFPVPPTDVTGNCTADETTACLNNQRFAVQAVGSDGPLSITGTEASNAAGFAGDDTEGWVQVLNGCSFNEHFWVFAAAATGVDFDLVVTDTATNETFTSPLGMPAPAITDTSAFATCP